MIAKEDRKIIKKLKSPLTDKGENFILKKRATLGFDEVGVHYNYVSNLIEVFIEENRKERLQSIF